MSGRPSPHRIRYLHVSADARRRYGLATALFGLRGRIVFGDMADAQSVAGAINDGRNAGRFPEAAVRGGEVYAAALLHELMHALIEGASAGAGDLFAPARERVGGELGDDAAQRLLSAFATGFPVPGVADGAVSVPAYLAGTTDGVANPSVVLEELLLLHLANANPALERLHELFDDAPLRRVSAYAQAVTLVEDVLAGEGDVGGSGRTLIDLLWAPQRTHPTSLEGQLEYVRTHWGDLLGERYASLLQRLLRSLDVLHEEHKAGFVGPGPAPVLTAAALRGPVEVEAFSPDSAWMPGVVMIAKSTYVWLAQLERRYGRPVHRLDQIPDDALEELAARGFNALWLIGVWQRSEASRRIKHERGQADAVASAYALYDYVIADDLGGEGAYADLRERAARRGLRLASDMVPNHVGIDGRWVIEHPEWFLQLDRPPYPGYGFAGPDLSGDGRIAVRIEDHYWNGTDAAVVFQRVDNATGEARYIYHGNDGTAMPWNDTAQLDYLRPDVREAVIGTILHVARKFPIIRFDAAMTLAKQHIQRLWYPPPGQGGAIPSRSQYGGIDADEFERRIPVEFWREVVDRVAAEAPGTLLLAEAFWMMEGYFVRTLGMHRVYNSAFMNMLKREENAEYRLLVKNVLEFDPRILERFVNFMNNPDEETAIAQFGDGDKYFGVATLMATLPGLPMFGHGQVEGFREKYGMEYRRPKLDEDPSGWLVDRHLREIAPLLHRREQFSGSRDFRLFDLIGDEGAVREDVYAYANRGGGRASLVLFNNRFERATGWLRDSAPFASGGATTRTALASALGLQGGGGRFALLRDVRAGRTFLQRSDELARDGLRVALEGFQTQVFTDVQEVTDRDGSYEALHAHLAGRGVADLEAARLDLRLSAVHEAFLALVAGPAADTASSASASEPARSPSTAESDGAGEPASGGRTAAEAGAPRPSGGGIEPWPAPQARDFVAAVRRVSGEPLRPEAGLPGAAAGRQSAGGGTPAAAAPDAAASNAGASDAGASDAGASDAAVVAAIAAGLGHEPAPAPKSVARPAATGPDDGEPTEAVPPLLVRAAAALSGLAERERRYRDLRLAGALARRLEGAGIGDAAALAELPPALWAVTLPQGGVDSVAAAQGTGTRKDRAAPDGPDRAGAGVPTTSMVLERWVADGGARAFLGVNSFEGIEYFNRERYRQLVAGFDAYLARRGVDAASRAALVAELAAAERASGYRLARLGSTPEDAPRADGSTVGRREAAREAHQDGSRERERSGRKRATGEGSGGDEGG